MQVDKVTFQANIPSRLKEKLFTIANSKGSKTCDAYFEHAKRVESWGLDTSIITERRSDGRDGALSLVNSYFAPFKRAEFPQKENLFDTFMALTERDIQNAENALEI